jgi:hypothetical protein
MKRHHESSSSAEDDLADAKKIKLERQEDTYATPYQLLSSVMKHYSIDGEGVRYAIVRPQTETSANISFVRDDNVIHIGEGATPGCPTKSPKFDTVDSVRYSMINVAMDGFDVRSAKFLFHGCINVYDMQKR